jgi:hypothetical protein
MFFVAHVAVRHLALHPKTAHSTPSNCRIQDVIDISVAL